jgi:hypothetical protein
MLQSPKAFQGNGGYAVKVVQELLGTLRDLNASDHIHGLHAITESTQG